MHGEQSLITHPDKKTTAAIAVIARTTLKITSTITLSPSSHSSL
jgi:hypothetical protein